MVNFNRGVVDCRCLTIIPQLSIIGLLTYGRVTTEDYPYLRGPDDATEVTFDDQTTITLLLFYTMPPTEGRSPENSVTRFPVCFVCYQAGHHLQQPRLKFAPTKENVRYPNLKSLSIFNETSHAGTSTTA